jgi:hypothetical protein
MEELELKFAGKIFAIQSLMKLSFKGKYMILRMFMISLKAIYTNCQLRLGDL